ncbi:MAG: hypothetical protein ACKOBY_09930, partial [Cyanobium sp.]
MLLLQGEHAAPEPAAAAVLHQGHGHHGVSVQPAQQPEAGGQPPLQRAEQSLDPGGMVLLALVDAVEVDDEGARGLPRPRRSRSVAEQILHLGQAVEPSLPEGVLTHQRDDAGDRDQQQQGRAAPAQQQLQVGGAEQGPQPAPKTPGQQQGDEQAAAAQQPQGEAEVEALLGALERRLPAGCRLQRGLDPYTGMPVALVEDSGG